MYREAPPARARGRLAAPVREIKRASPACPRAGPP